MKFSCFIASFALLGVCAYAAGPTPDLPPSVVEEIIAKVNGDIVTRSEMDRSRKQLEAALRQQGAKGPELDKAIQERSKNILRDRIDELLLVQKGKELSINVDAEVSKQLAEIQLQSKIADPEKFQQFVKEQTGESYEDYKAEVKNGLLRMRVVRQEVGGRINIPRAELQKYYEEHKSEFVREEQVFLREILVSTEGKDEKGIAVAEKKAKDLAARAKKGEKFGDLARDNSDAVTARNYGELGAFKRGELNPQLEGILWKQERGFVTDPIRVQNGFLILKIEEKYKAGQASFEEVENQIMDKLFMPRMEPAVRQYLTKLREDAFLEIKPGYEDTAPAPGKNTAWQDPAQLKPETVTKEEVASQTRRKRLLWAIPLPGTKSTGDSGKSSSK